MVAGPGSDRPSAGADRPTPLAQALIDEIEAGGPRPFDQVVDRALYDPDLGFYGSGAGRAGGDFLTSPEVGPLFGAVLARALDRWWDELGRPDPFTVVEAGAGVGTLARAVLAAGPACGPALRYVMVERSAALVAHHRDHIDLETGDPAVVDGGSGPRVWSRPDLPDGPITGVVVANELLDNLPFALLARGSAGWFEVQVGRGAGEDGTADLVEVLVPASPAATAWAEAVAPDATAGARVPDQARARAWVGGALDRLGRGVLVVLDYGDTTAGLAARPPDDWVRTYQAHGPGVAPLERLGRQDITCEVAFDQLAAVSPPTRVSSQADFLADHGLDELVAEGRRVWAERAHIGDLEAVRGRSRVGEAEALSDPGGLGAFRVLEWHRR